MGGCLSGRERVDDHVHGEGGEKGRQKKDNDKDNDTGWEQAAACGGGSTKCLDSYLAGVGLPQPTTMDDDDDTIINGQ
jgi:hypothetical protein